MKRILSALFFFMAVAMAGASTTTITASYITDLTGNRVPAARLCFVPVDASGIAIGYRSSTAQVVPVKKCGLVSNGALQSGFTVIDSSSTVPTNVRYHITLTPVANTSATLRDFGTTTITGTLWTLDTFDPNATALPALFTASSTSGSLAVNGDLSVTGTTTLGTTTINTLTVTNTIVGTVQNAINAAVASKLANSFTATDGAGSSTTFNGSAAQTIGYVSTTQTSTQTIVSQLNVKNNVRIGSDGGGNYGLEIMPTKVGGSIFWIDNPGIDHIRISNGNAPNDSYPFNIYNNGDVVIGSAADCGYPFCVSSSQPVLAEFLSTYTTNAAGAFVVGASTTTYNAATLKFFQSASGSTSNRFGIGLWGNDYIFNVFGSGDVSIGSITDSGNKLYVNGRAYVAGDYGTIMMSDVYAQQRLVYGNYGVMHRVDSGNYYILITNANDAYGAWNSLRPLYVNLSSGDVTMGSSVGVGGSLTVYGAVSGASWSATSDRRDKYDIETVDPNWALTRVMKIRAVHYKWNDAVLDRGYQTGWIAQEVESGGLASSVESRPGKVYSRDGTTTEVPDARTLKQNEMTAYLWAAVQQQQREINQLRKQIKHRKGAR